MSSHSHHPGGPPPHGQGLVAATSRNRAGRTAWLWARETLIEPLLQRLAQPVEGRRGELAELVEEQHAAAGEGDLPWSQGRRTAADQGDGGGGVVRRPERRHGDEAAAGHRAVRPPSGPSWRRATRSGRAAAARRAVVGRASSCPTPVSPRGAGGARRRRRSPAPGGRRAGPARRPDREATARRCQLAGPGSSGHGASPASASRTSPSVEATRTPRGEATWASALEVLGTTATTSPSTATIGATPGTRRSEASRPSSPTKPWPSTSPGRSCSLATRTPMAMARSSPAPDLRVPDGARLTVIALLRPLAPRAQHGGAHPVPRLTAHRVGHADDAVPGQSRADMDLDADRAAAGAEQAGGRDGCEHGGPPTTLGRIGGGRDGGRPHDGIGDGTNGVSRSRRPAGRRGSSFSAAW